MEAKKRRERMAILAGLWATGMPLLAAADEGLVDIAADVGIAENTPAYHMAVADYNGDGWPDILLNRRWAVPFRLYKNVGGSFVEDLSINFGIRDRLDCQWGDPNVDGRLDLYCARGASHGTAMKANQLWIQQADGSFQEQGIAWGAIDPYGRGRSVGWFNFNGDEFPDLFVGNHFPRADGIPSANRLYVNQAGTNFAELEIPGFTAELGGYCVYPVDMDKDGFDDLLVCGGGRLYMFRNTAGTGFAEMAAGLGLDKYTRSVLAPDVDKDGQPDLVVVTPQTVSIFHGRGGWSFSEPQVIGGTNMYDAVAADVDGDADLDIYVSTTNPIDRPNLPDMLLRNNGAGVFVHEAVASSAEGDGGRVAAIDHDLDGRSGFLVVNSRGVGPGGPVQFFEDPAPIVVPPSNLVVNGDFETGTLAPWDSWASSLELVQDELRGGSWVGRVTKVQGGGQTIPVKPNTTYTLRAVGRVDVAHWAAAGIRYRDAQWNQIPSANRNLVPFGTEYEERSLTFVTPANAATVLVQVWNGPGGTVWVDDLSLVEVTETP
ncbi:hypothetical protein EWI61_01310 [Methylolobus aquaticus]|nr:hypothetical protein EWI61_01310 [Methylolobus aquaticus]